jgi:hypothetical protein
MVHTTPPKEDKVDTSSAEAPTAQTLVARPGSKAPDDNLADEDPNLSLVQRCWIDSGKLDYPVWYFGWSSFHNP